MNNVKLYVGNSLTRLKELEDNSIDSIVTDPPYEIGYIGHGWDSTGIAYSVELWAEALRVLKPGGHLLSFGATRTWHRMAVAVEDAGFEIRDQIAWLYNSGMPKGMNISKQLDKMATKEPKDVAHLYNFTEWMRSTGLTAKQLNEATGTNMGSHYLTDKTQPAIPTPELFEKLRPLLVEREIEIPEWIEDFLLGKASKEVKERTNVFNLGEWVKENHQAAAKPVTAEAQKWQGWNTALKPSFEPVIVARKPIDKTNIPTNVIAYGTGALNITANRYNHEGVAGGRYPSNVMIDEGAASILQDDSRFFYIAKPSKNERPIADGLAHPTVKPLALMRQLIRLVTPPGGVVLDIFAGSGSTLEAAALEGFDSIGFELTEEYVPLIEVRAERSKFNLKVL